MIGTIAVLALAIYGAICAVDTIAEIFHADDYDELARRDRCRSLHSARGRR